MVTSLPEVFDLQLFLRSPKYASGLYRAHCPSNSHGSGLFQGQQKVYVIWHHDPFLQTKCRTGKGLLNRLSHTFSYRCQHQGRTTIKVAPTDRGENTPHIGNTKCQKICACFSIIPCFQPGVFPYGSFHFPHSPVGATLVVARDKESLYFSVSLPHSDHVLAPVMVTSRKEPIRLSSPSSIRTSRFPGVRAVRAKPSSSQTPSTRQRRVFPI